MNDLNIGDKVRILTGVYTNCTGNVRNRYLGSKNLYLVEIPFGLKSNAMETYNEDGIQLMKRFEHESSPHPISKLKEKMIRGKFDDLSDGFFSFDDDFDYSKLGSRNSPLKPQISIETPIFFTKDELMEILGQDKSAEEILMDFKDHLTN